MQHMAHTNNIKYEGGAAHSVMDGGPHTNACLLRMRCDVEDG